jgi:hypothetical protein
VYLRLTRPGQNREIYGPAEAFLVGALFAAEENSTLTLSISRLCRCLFIARLLSPSNQAGAIDSDEVSERTDGVDSTGRGRLAVINRGQSCCGRLQHVISNDVDGIHHTSSPAQRGRKCHCGGLQFVRHASLYFGLPRGSSVSWRPYLQIFRNPFDVCWRTDVGLSMRQGTLPPLSAFISSPQLFCSTVPARPDLSAARA